MAGNPARGVVDHRHRLAYGFFRDKLCIRPRYWSSHSSRPKIGLNDNLRMNMTKRSVPAVVLFLSLAALLFSQQGSAPQTASPKGDIARGKQVFESTCDECHDAYSREERVGPGLQGIKNGKLPDGRLATHDKLLDIVNNGPAEMPSFRDRLTDQQKEDVVAFVMTL